MTSNHETSSPVERRLDEHLELLRQDPPHPPDTLVPRVTHTARWQHAMRQPLVALAGVATAIAEGVRVLLGKPSDRR
jgi:hypothetical protein